MGSVCCCFHVEDIEDHNVNESSNRDCLFPNCFIHNLLSKYATLFNREEMHATPSSIQAAASLTSTGVLDNTLSDTNRSPPSPLPYNANSRYSNLPQDGQVSRIEKGTGHSHENLDPLRKSNVRMGPEFVCGGHKPNGSYCEGGSEQCHSKSSVKLSLVKVASGVGYVYSSSEDEDVCPTCLEEYSPENPKIITHCSHHFHLGCIYEWMERSESCPVCGKLMMFDETS